MNNNRTLIIAVGLIAFCGFLLLVVFLVSGLGRLKSPASSPTIDLFATLSASTPVSAFSPAPIKPTSTSAFDFSESPAQQTSTPAVVTDVPTVSSGDGPTGNIVFTCQIYKFQSSDQICIMNADGTGYRRLTTEDGVRHFYPSLSPDGRKVLYSSFRESNVYEIYSYDLENGDVDRLTNRIGVLNAPEYSPDGQSITFMRWNPTSDRYQIMIMERNGNNPNNIPRNRRLGPNLVTGWEANPVRV